MKVDRSLFLVFTGAIAASAVACVVKEYQPPPPPPPAPPPPAALGGPARNVANPHIQPLHVAGGQPTNNPPPHIVPIGPHNGPTPTPPAGCLDEGSVAAPTCSASLTSSSLWQRVPDAALPGVLAVLRPEGGRERRQLHERPRRQQLRLTARLRLRQGRPRTIVPRQLDDGADLSDRRRPVQGGRERLRDDALGPEQQPARTPSRSVWRAAAPPASTRASKGSARRA